MRKAFFALAIASTALSAGAQTEVNKYIPGVTAEGVTYYLPRTELRITIVATRTTRIPGDFKDYAARYLRLSDVTQQTETTWKIDKVYITPFGVPDTTKVYNIPLKKKTVAPLVGLTKNGIITSINTEGQEDPMAEVPEINKVEKSQLKPRDYMTEEILYAGSKSKMAELTAAEIYDIRESRSQLSKGQADNMPKDGQQLKLMMSQLDTQEQALLQLFKGTEETETKTVSLTFNPTADTKGQVLFRFSQEEGVVGSDDLSGEPVYISIADQKTIPAEQTDGKGKKPIEDAVRYNVASQVKIAVFDRSNKYAEITTPMGQFGRVELLSNELFNKRLTTKVTFYSTTGGIKKITDQTGGE